MADERANVIPPSRSIRDYLSDIRVIQVIVQLVFIVVLVGSLAVVWSNVLQTLDQRGLTLQWGFLLTNAGFQISEAPDWYSSRSSSYGQAFLVGIVNTLRVVSVGLVAATIIGILVGIFLLSRNWLIKTLSRIYVEILRNTPLLVQLYFWYFIVFFSLPDYATPLAIPGEGLARIPIQYPIYIFLLLAGWLLARRSKFPQYLNMGIVLGIILYEVTNGFLTPALASTPLGDPILALLSISVLGFVLAYLFAPPRWQTLSAGVLLIIFGQGLISFFIFVFFYLGIAPSPDELIFPVASAIFLTNKGLALPELLVTQQFAQWSAFLGIGVALAIGMWIYSGHVTETTGRPMPRFWFAVASIGAFGLFGWWAVTSQHGEVLVPVDDTFISLEQARLERLIDRELELQVAPEPLLTVLPRQGRFRFETGTQISLEYGALLVGLVIYTSAFIAEIVRAGIQAVPYGQLEAARALGLSQSQTLTQVILPQALRVIIPPLGNQYLNLSKNSSLAVAVAFADTYQVGTTVMNQSGQSLVGFFLVGVVYLSLSLIISLFMNIVNSRFQLVTR